MLYDIRELNLGIILERHRVQELEKQKQNLFTEAVKTSRMSTLTGSTCLEYIIEKGWEAVNQWKEALL